MTRQKKTPRARAEEALAVADRKVGRLQRDVARHKAAHDAATAELRAATERRDYAAADPALQTPQQRPVPDTTDTARRTS